MELSQRRYRDAVRALRSLERGGHAARLAGGCVRDRLLGTEPADYDVATTAAPDEVMAHFKAEGVKTVPTGLAHGTVTLVMESGPVEITTLRLDVATDGRHAVVQFGGTFEADAARRDFTVNAMFEDAAGVVYDYFSGRADLDAKVLRFVGVPAERIREDYLRILRLFRFWARLGFAPAPGTLAAVAAERDGLRRISQERITSELVRMLAAPASALAPALAAMAAAGVWELVLPELAPAAGLPPGALLAQWQTAAPSVRSLAVLGGLLIHFGLTDPSAVRAIGERLKLASADTRRLAKLPEVAARLARGFEDTASALDLVDACEAAGGAGALDGFFLPALAGEAGLAEAAQTVRRAEAAAGFRRAAKLPLSGTQVARHLGVTPGPRLGEVLGQLKRSYRNGLWRTSEEGLAWLDAHGPPG